MRGDQQRVQERPGAHAYRRGYWYIAGDEAMLVATGAALGAGVLRLYPFRLRAAVQIIALGARITTQQAGLMQLGIYPASKRTLQPEGLPVAVTGDIDVSAAVNVSGVVLGGPVILPRGVYWGAENNNIGALIAQIGGPASSSLGALVGGSTQDMIAPAATNIASIRNLPAVTYGTWPDVSKTPTNEASPSQGYALLQFQVAP